MVRYHSYDVLDPAAGLVDSVAIRGNGLHDPDVATGGHQPMGFDQMMANYNHYLVVGAKITARFQSGGGNPFVCGIILQDQAALHTGATVTSALIESGMSQYKTVGQQATGNYPSATMSRGYSAKRFFGKGYRDRDYMGGVTSDPSDQSYFILWAGPVDGSQNVEGNLKVQYTVEYIVDFIEPKPPIQS